MKKLINEVLVFLEFVIAISFADGENVTSGPCSEACNRDMAFPARERWELIKQHDRRTG